MTVETLVLQLVVEMVVMLDENLVVVLGSYLAAVMAVEKAVLTDKNLVALLGSYLAAMTVASLV